MSSWQQLLFPLVTSCDSVNPRTAQTSMCHYKLVMETAPFGKANKAERFWLSCGGFTHRSIWRYCWKASWTHIIDTSADGTCRVTWPVHWPMEIEHYNWMEEATHYCSQLSNQQEKYSNHSGQQTTRKCKTMSYCLEPPWTRFDQNYSLCASHIEWKNLEITIFFSSKLKQK